ncbi:hypothetical protein RDWZM_000125 [Blomia tropicalis]|uniref:Uncharacterized protein n=1 Tax=Blomia tropicalis TaxID=40697 RepID=A0A9Q0M9C2_BLOTA|nr:hypothetical protein RDWZM_000125 [Blomia tropicalis]
MFPTNSQTKEQPSISKEISENIYKTPNVPIESSISLNKMETATNSLSSYQTANEFIEGEDSVRSLWESKLSIALQLSNPKLIKLDSVQEPKQQQDQKSQAIKSKSTTKNTNEIDDGKFIQTQSKMSTITNQKIVQLNNLTITTKKLSQLSLETPVNIKMVPVEVQKLSKVNKSEIRMNDRKSSEQSVITTSIVDLKQLFEQFIKRMKIISENYHSAFMFSNEIILYELVVNIIRYCLISDFNEQKRVNEILKECKQQVPNDLRQSTKIVTLESLLERIRIYDTVGQMVSTIGVPHLCFIGGDELGSGLVSLRNDQQYTIENLEQTIESMDRIIRNLIFNWKTPMQCNKNIIDMKRCQLCSLLLIRSDFVYENELEIKIQNIELHHEQEQLARIYLTDYLHRWYTHQLDMTSIRLNPLLETSLIIEGTSNVTHDQLKPINVQDSNQQKMTNDVGNNQINNEYFFKSLEKFNVPIMEKSIQTIEQTSQKVKSKRKEIQTLTDFLATDESLFNYSEFDQFSSTETLIFSNNHQALLKLIESMFVIKMEKHISQPKQITKLPPPFPTTIKKEIIIGKDVAPPNKILPKINKEKRSNVVKMIAPKVPKLFLPKMKTQHSNHPNAIDTPNEHTTNVRKKLESQKTNKKNSILANKKLNSKIDSKLKSKQQHKNGKK